MIILKDELTFELNDRSLPANDLGAQRRRPPVLEGSEPGMPLHVLQASPRISEPREHTHSLRL